MAVPLWLVACHDATDSHNRTDPVNVVSAKKAGSAAPAVTAKATIAESSAMPRHDSMEAVKGEEGARAVLNEWARALERRDWAAAWAEWGHGGADSGMNREAFITAYEKYATAKVIIGDGETDGAAGSIYYAVPVTITGELLDGRSYRLEGPVTLRRVNDVDGATAEELAWHISQSDLKPRP